MSLEPQPSNTVSSQLAFPWPSSPSSILSARSSKRLSVPSARNLRRLASNRVSQNAASTKGTELTRIAPPWPIHRAASPRGQSGGYLGHRSTGVSAEAADRNGGHLDAFPHPPAE